MDWKPMRRLGAFSLCVGTLLAASATAQEAGHTPGEFSVDGTGAATY
jgi:hypothetical protein